MEAPATRQAMAPATRPAISPDTRAVESTLVNKNFTIKFHEGGGFTISSNSELNQGLMLEITKQVAIRIRDSQRPKAYGTFITPPTTNVGGAGAENTDPHECCLLWCIPMCVRNCFKKICCG